MYSTEPQGSSHNSKPQRPFNKVYTEELKQNYVAYTDYGFNGKRSSSVAREGVIKNKKLADGSSAVQEVDANEIRNLRKMRVKSNPNEYLVFSNGSIYEEEQRFVPFYSGRIYGFRVPEKIRKYKQYNKYGDSAGLGGFSQFPNNYTKRAGLAQRIASSTDGEI